MILRGELMRELRYLCLVLALFFTMFIPTTTLAESYSLNATQSDGHRTVGMTYVNDQWEIAVKDLTTGRIKLLTNDPLAQGYPDIKGSYIVYQQEVVNEKGNQLGFDIMLMNIETGEVERISTKTTNNIYPKINEKYIVWREFERIIRYDRTSKQLNEIGSEDARSFGVHLSEDQIVWMDVRSGHFDIYLQEANSELELQITKSDAKQMAPHVSNGIVLWHDYRDGTRQIYSYDTITQQEQYLTEGSIRDFKHGVLLYRSGSENKVRDVDNGVERTVDNSVMELVIVNGKLYMLGNELSSVPSLQTSSHSSSSQPVTWDWRDSEQEYLQVYAPSNIHSLLEFESLTSREGILDTFEVVGNIQYIIANRSVLNDQGKYRFAVSGKIEEVLLYKVMGFDNQKQQWVELESVNDDGYLYFSPGNTNSYILVKYTHTLNDMNTHWANASVKALASKEIIHGYSDGQFKPSKDITRAEFVKMLLLTLNIPISANRKSPFTDIEGHWSQEYIDTAYALGIAYGNGKMFLPNTPMTREEMVTLTMRAVDLQGNDLIVSNNTLKLNDFEDYGKVSLWAYDFMESAVEQGIIRGANDTLLPQDTTTRAEAATMLFRILQAIDLRLKGEVYFDN